VTRAKRRYLLNLVQSRHRAPFVTVEIARKVFDLWVASWPEVSLWLVDQRERGQQP
jgi:hypothetical protein